MPFGLCNAPATFQCLMNRVFEPSIGNFIRAFLDDFCIYGSKMDHLYQMETTFQRLDEAQASLNPKKCVFGCSKGVLLGHVVSRDGIGIDPNKVSKIKELPSPMNRSKLRSFLGHVGYYRRFIKNFSKIAQPLTQFLKKDVTYELGNKAHEAFGQLKESLVSSPVLKNLDWSKPFIVYTDASDAALGSTLSQKDENGNEHPIYFGSRQMSSAEVNYTVTEKEALAIIFAVKKFRNYLLGKKFLVVTDHQALKYIVNKPNPSGRIARWIILLQEFEFDIIDRPGKKHVNADALSRAYDGLGSSCDDDDFPDATLFSLDTIRSEYIDIWNYLNEFKFPNGSNAKTKRKITQASRPYSILHGVLFRIGPDGQYKRAVGRDQGKELLEEFHNGTCGGHFSGQLTARRILDAGYHWPTLFKYCYNYCKTCDICQTHGNRKTSSTPLCPILPLGPFEKWGINIVGPLPTTSHQNKYVVVTTYYLTKWVEARPLKTASMDEVARFIYERIVTRFGCPLEIVTDQGSHFINEVVEALVNKFSIKHRKATTYKPSTNGQVERTNFVLCQILAKDVALQVHKWDKRIHAALWAYRATSKSATGYSPFQLAYGIDPVLPIEFDIPTVRVMKNERMDESDSVKE
ncbi:hypothetical protein KI387_020693, partial [Taxus chinensis]